MYQAPGDSPRRGRRLSLGLALCVIALAATASVAAAASGGTAKQTETIKVGLITKDVTNPFFVKMKAGATVRQRSSEPSCCTPPGRTAPTTRARSPRSRTW